MQYRSLGSTNLSVSAVGIGTWQFSGVWDKSFEQAEVNALFARAGELGVNFIDTAECYGDHLSEGMIGEAIDGDRERWVIATKFGHNPANDLGDENFGPAQVRKQLEASLRALRTDYIDVYQIHSASDELFDNDALWTMLDEQVNAGKVRYLGNSIGMPNQRWQVEQSARFGIRVIQTIYNAVRPGARRHIFPVAEEQNLGVIARVPLASGFLSGKYRPGHKFPHSDVRSWRPQDGVDREIARALAALEEKPAAMAPSTWAGAWCLQNPRVSTIIPGAKSLTQLEENAAAADVRLD
ncbi:MAG: aldo/keto reductase [Halioglobus sp.]|nr:aldo/keto reductase [Halioglobus sp.]